jgi:hypothetical protein
MKLSKQLWQLTWRKKITIFAKSKISAKSRDLIYTQGSHSDTRIPLSKVCQDLVSAKNGGWPGLPDFLCTYTTPKRGKYTNDPQNIPNGHRQDLVSAKNGGWPGLKDFLCTYNTPKRVKYTKRPTKYYKWSYNRPSSHNIFQMVYNMYICQYFPLRFPNWDFGIKYRYHLAALLLTRLQHFINKSPGLQRRW